MPPSPCSRARTTASLNRCLIAKESTRCYTVVDVPVLKTKGKVRMLTKMTKKCGIALLVAIASVAALAANEPQFAIKESHRDSSGVTFRTAAGTLRIEACGDRVIHVVASPTSEIPGPKVPIVTQPCRAENVVIKIGKKDVKLSTAGITVSVNATTGAVSFLSKDGKIVLAEPKDGGKSFDLPSLAEMKPGASSKHSYRLRMSSNTAWDSIRTEFSMFVACRFACTRQAPTSPSLSCCRARDMVFSGQSIPDRFQSGRRSHRHRSGNRQGKVHHKSERKLRLPTGQR